MTNSAAGKKDAVALLEQIAAIQNEGDNDVREVRIAKFSDAVLRSSLNHFEKEQVEESVKVRDWPALTAYLENL
jgi:hypothetical protein